MNALILAGGLGTRLSPLTALLPKPMVPVLNRPLLEHTLTLLKKHGIEDITFLLYHLPETIQSHFGNGSQFGVHIDYVVANQDFGTAGAVKQASRHIDTSFLLLSGDALTDIDLSRMQDFHAGHGGIATIALSRVQNPSPFGVAITDANNRIARFVEKPAWSQIFSDTVNMGIYVLEPGILEHIESNSEVYFARDVFPDLLTADIPIFGFDDECYWRDVGDLKTYQQVQWDALAGRIALDAFSGVEPDATSLVGRNCLIDPDAQLQNAVVGDNCTIGKYALLKDTIVWDNVQIGDGCDLGSSVVASGSTIGANSRLCENVFVSQNVSVGARCTLRPNIRVWPEKIIDVGSVVNSSLIWGDSWQRELFADSRVTGLANLEVSPEFASRLGGAFGSWLGKSHSVLLSRDASSAARMIYRSLITGLMSVGVNVNTVQVMPIPIVRHALPALPEQAGLHIRRSPVNRKCIDILFFDEVGRAISTGAAKAVERLFFREEYPRVGIDEVGRIEYPVRIAESYVADFRDHLNIAAIEDAHFKIVTDYSFGAATQIFPSVLGGLDCEVISLNAYPDQHKLCRSHEDTERALEQLAGIVKSTGADAGFLMDAGAEKIRVVTETGTILSGERLAVLVTRLFLEQRQPPRIAAPVSIPNQVADFAAAQRVEVSLTSESHAALIESTLEPDVQFAVDRSGGFIYPEFHFAFDGMFSLVKILELLATAGSSLAQLDAQAPRRYFGQRTLPCSWEAKGKVMRNAAEESDGAGRVLKDGVKIIFDDDWVLVIVDRDTAVCHIMAETCKPDSLAKLLAKYEAKVMNWIES